MFHYLKVFFHIMKKLFHLMEIFKRMKIDVHLMRTDFHQRSRRSTFHKGQPKARDGFKNKVKKAREKTRGLTPPKNND